MADFQFNPETGQYDYVGDSYKGAPEPEAQPDAAALEPEPQPEPETTLGAPAAEEGVPPSEGK